MPVYPSPATLYRWLKHKKSWNYKLSCFAGLHKGCSSQTHSCNMPRHPRHPSAGIKLDALRRCFELGEDVEYISREIGYSCASIYKWRRSYLEKGGAGLMSARKKIQREPLIFRQISELPASTDVVRLQNLIDRLQMKVDILHETIHVHSSNCNIKVQCACPGYGQVNSK